MNRFRTLNGCKTVTKVLTHSNILDNSRFPDNEQTRLYEQLYGDGQPLDSKVTSLRPELSAALSQLLFEVPTSTRFPDDSLAFEIMRQPDETKEAYKDRLSKIIVDSFNSQKSDLI